MTERGVREQGGRAKNEDYIGMERQNGISCYVVADGLGGHGSGEVASKTAVDEICAAFKQNPEISTEALRSYFDSAQDAVVKKREEDILYRNMATTIVVLLTDGKKAVWGHLGDTRLYRLEKKELIEITDDHSVAFVSWQIGEIDHRDIRNSPDQNKLLKILGDNDKYEPQIQPVISVNKHTKFLLCTDGYWKYVTEEDVERTANETKNVEAWIGRMNAIVERNLNPKSDNYSAIAVYCK